MEEPKSSHEEEARMQAEMMKLKLIAEHGAHIHMSENSPLSAEMELAWFNHIANFEQLSKDAGYALVYDFIGKPIYQKAEELQSNEFESELDRLLAYMYNKGVCLNFEDEDAETIYRFVTEELFYEKMNCYLGPGGGGHAMFDYYEFHPNHYKDITRYAEEYLNPLFKTAEWEGEYLEYSHSNFVSVNGVELDLATYSNKMAAFKHSYPLDDFLQWEIDPVVIDLVINKAEVNGHLKLNTGVFPFKITYQCEYGLWCICGLELALIGS